MFQDFSGYTRWFTKRLSWSYSRSLYLFWRRRHLSRGFFFGWYLCPRRYNGGLQLNIHNWKYTFLLRRCTITCFCYFYFYFCFFFNLHTKYFLGIQYLFFDNKISKSFFFDAVTFVGSEKNNMNKVFTCVLNLIENFFSFLCTPRV